MLPHSSATRKFHQKIGLVIGFWAVIAGVLVAHGSPATGYEVSMYTMTPDPVWICLGVGLLIAIYVGLSSTLTDTLVLRAPALVLGGLSVITFIGIPIIRGYHFNGHNDSLTHLGWATAISEGTISPFELLYPAIHTVSVIIESVIEIPLPRSMLFIPVLATLVFFVFIPLAVRELVLDSSKIVIGAICAFLLLPITTITTNMHPHAMSQTILLSALPVYIIVKYISEEPADNSVSAVGILFSVVTLSTVVYHPQYIAHMIAALIGICVVQFVARRSKPNGRIASHRVVYGQVLVMISVFLLWSANHGFFNGFAERAVVSAAMFFVGDAGQAGTSVAAQGASLQNIGSGLGEVFVKLFFPQLALSLFAGGLILWAIFQAQLHRYRDVSAFAIYFAAALFNLAALFIVYFVSQTSEMYFRVFGLMMVFITILGAIAIDHSLVERVRRLDSQIGRGFAAVCFGVLITVSLLSVFPSPYIYNQSHHVSEMEMSGYESVFSNQDGLEDADLVGFRNAPNRYADAIIADSERNRAHGSLDEASFEEGLDSYYEDETYIVITKGDYEREVTAYEGLRYSEADFEAVDSTPGINKLQSNGELDLYHVPADSV